MKKLIFYFCAIIFVFGFVKGSDALPIYDAVDWDGRVKKGRTATKMFDKNGSFTLAHSVSFGDINRLKIVLT